MFVVGVRVKRRGRKEKREKKREVTVGEHEIPYLVGLLLPRIIRPIRKDPVSIQRYTSAAAR